MGLNLWFTVLALATLLCQAWAAPSSSVKSSSRIELLSSHKASSSAKLTSGGIVTSNIETRNSDTVSANLVKPSKTFCPQYYTTTISPSPTNQVCGGIGTVTRPYEIDRICYVPNALYNDDTVFDPDANDDDNTLLCYRSCSNNSKCISYAWDRFNQVCRLYGKSLTEMGFRRRETAFQMWDLRGCFVCNQDPLPKKKSCPIRQELKPAGQRKNAVCGVIGKSLAPRNISRYYQAYYGNESCYSACTDWATVGLCESFQWDRSSTENCVLFPKTLREGGFVPDDDSTPIPDGLYSWDLRGCYKCDLDEAPLLYSFQCNISDPLVAPKLKNGRFSKTIFNRELNVSQPTDWIWGDRDVIKSLEDSKGNTYLQMQGSRTSIYSRLADFNINPYVPGRFYNLTFDLGVGKEYYANRTRYDYCYLGVDAASSGSRYIRLRNVAGKAYSSNLTTQGPIQFDISNGSYDRERFFDIFITCRNFEDFPELTVRIDNVAFSQNGKVVAGAGA